MIKIEANPGIELTVRMVVDCVDALVKHQMFNCVTKIRYEKNCIRVWTPGAVYHGHHAYKHNVDLVMNYIKVYVAK